MTRLLDFPGQTNDSETRLFQNWNHDYNPSFEQNVQSDAMPGCAATLAPTGLRVRRQTFSLDIKTYAIRHEYLLDLSLYEVCMFIGVTAPAIDLIRRGYPEDCEELQNGQVIMFRLSRDDGAKHYSLGLGTMEPKYVIDCPFTDVAGLRLYISVPDEYVPLYKRSVLHFNQTTKEFETIELFLADEEK